MAKVLWPVAIDAQFVNTKRLSTMTLLAQLIADLAHGARRLVIGFLLLVPSLGPSVADNLRLFSTELEARGHCESDIVVWLDTATGIYHLKGMRWYGNTTSGAFVCQKEGDRAGYRLSVFCRYCSGHADEAHSAIAPAR
jgi:hypothetical protein